MASSIEQRTNNTHVHQCDCLRSPLSGLRKLGWVTLACSQASFSCMIRLPGVCLFSYLTLTSARSFLSYFLWQKWLCPSNMSCLSALTHDPCHAINWGLVTAINRSLQKGRRRKVSAWAYASPWVIKETRTWRAALRSGRQDHETTRVQDSIYHTSFAFTAFLGQAEYIPRCPDCQREYQENRVGPARKG
jgi:hypothetical protein